MTTSSASGPVDLVAERDRLAPGCYNRNRANAQSAQSSELGQSKTITIEKQKPIRA